MTRLLHILNVANKCLPDHDYRIQYRERSSTARVTFGLPGKPASLDSEEFVEMGFREGISLTDLAIFFALGKHLFKCRGKYDLIHFFSTKLQLFGPFVAASLGVPCVSTITGFGRTFNRTELRYRLLRPIYLWLLRRSVALSKAFFFQNHGDKRWLQEKFPEQSHKMHWIGSAVEAEVVRQKDFEKKPLIVLMVARLMPDKGVDDYLEAARRLHGKQFRFLLVGPKSVGQEALYRQVELANEQGIIKYLGELDQQELSKCYEQSHVLAFPSHGEGMPRVMLEAGHALLCPIASDIPAHRDLIDQGAGFLIAKKEKVESLVAHLQAVQADRELLEKNALAFQQHIVSQYTVAAYANRMDKFLQNHFPTVQHHDKPSSDIRMAVPADLNALVAIHLQAFPGFFLTLLGSRFLTELYRSFLSAESGLCWVAERESSVVGFVVGTTEPARFFKKLLWRRSLFFLLAAAPALIRHPLAVGKKLLAALMYRGEAPILEGRGTLLSSLAVSPDIACQGEGSALVQAFYQSAGSRDSEFVYLTTDRNQNDRVNTFYQKLGFQLHSQYEKSGGRRMNCYVRKTSFELPQGAKQRAA